MLNKTLLRVGVVALFWGTFSAELLAQAEVVDRAPVATSAALDAVTTVQTTTVPPNNVANSVPDAAEPIGERASAPLVSAGTSGEMYYQLQVLQQEVMQLRGLVEEQAYQLKKLKQQRFDDYIELDRRISQLGDSAKSKAGSAPVASTALAVSAKPAVNELASYRKALDLILKQKDYLQGEAGMQAYLQSFPKGNYAANAYYWLGEIYLAKGDYASAKTNFAAMIEQFPGHRKVFDAKFKLGTVYDKMGDKASAKALLDEVAASSSDAAALARNYIKANFSS